MVTLVDRPGLLVRVSDEAARAHDLCPQCGGGKTVPRGLTQFVSLIDFGWAAAAWAYDPCPTCRRRGLVRKAAG